MAHARHLIIRTDANARIGTGHLMRCLALAQAWKDKGGEVTFVTACQSNGLLERLREEGFDIRMLNQPYPDPGDWDYTKDILAAYPDAWVVVDGYHFDEAYQQRIKESGHRLLVIDDMAHLKHYYADIVLNQNLHADQLHYFCEPYTRLLLGTRYVLLRREFLAWKGWKREIPEVARRVLVTLGGGDPGNYTLKVIQALQRIDVPGLEATVVIGASNPYGDVLQEAVNKSTIPIRLIRNARNMPELMAWADVAISSGGTTVWELAFMGVPSLIVVLAENQRLVAEKSDEEKVAINLGSPVHFSFEKIAQIIEHLLLDKNRRLEMSLRSNKLVDGEGCERVLMHIKGEQLRLRKVRKDDCKLLWEWANEPGVRASAFSSDSIPWEKHVEWFNNKLKDPNCLIFIAEDQQGIPVGQIRFDIKKNEEAEVDVSVDKDKRGLGYGALLIRQGVTEIFKTTKVKIVHAFIKPNNVSSIRSFEKAGFKYVGLEDVRGYKAKYYMVVRENET